MPLYNNGYPASYQNPYLIQQPVPPQQNGIIWIQGEAAAKSYLVAPNTSIALWDSESQTVYIKSADASGMPSMKVLDYTIRENPQAKPSPAPTEPPFDASKYITREEFEALTEQINGLKTRVGKLARRRDEEDE